VRAAFGRLLLRGHPLNFEASAGLSGRTGQRRRAGRAPRASRDLRKPRVHPGWRLDELRHQHPGHVSADRRLHRTDIQRRKAVLGPFSDNQASLLPQMSELGRDQIFKGHGIFNHARALREIHQTIDGVAGYFGVGRPTGRRPGPQKTSFTYARWDVIMLNLQPRIGVLTAESQKARLRYRLLDCTKEGQSWRSISFPTTPPLGPQRRA
jgi:hypothetical protein